MTKPPYNPPGQGPTLLYIFQSYLPEGGGAPEAVAEREAAAARLTLEYEDGKIECPGLKPGARLEPKEGLRLPRLVTVVSVEDGITTRIKVPSETEFYYGPPRLDVVDVDGTRTPAENFYGRLCITLPPPPPPYVPPRPAVEPVAPEILQQLAATIAAQLAPEKPSPSRSRPPPAPEGSKLEEKLEAAPDSNLQAKPSKKRRSGPRHPDWRKIAKRWGAIVKTRGPWPNAHAAKDEILKKQGGLTISSDALREGIQNYFPSWIDIESKE
jgi:hypothetical protein